MEKYYNIFEDKEFVDNTRKQLNDLFEKIINERKVKIGDSNLVFINHYHACAFRMEYGSFATSKDKKVSLKGANKKCQEYLTSIGKKMDKYEGACDSCPYMKQVFLDNDDNIVFII